jgi:hypothetical protein
LRSAAQTPNQLRSNHNSHLNSTSVRTESLEKILGDKAESYFRQIEKTLVMKPKDRSGSSKKSSLLYKRITLNLNASSISQPKATQEKK